MLYFIININSYLNVAALSPNHFKYISHMIEMTDNICEPKEMQPNVNDSYNTDWIKWNESFMSQTLQ